MTAENRREPVDREGVPRPRKVIELRSSSDAKLEQLGAQLEAFDSHLQLSSTQSATVLQRRLDDALDAVRKVRALHESRSAPGDEVRDAIAALEARLKPSAGTAMRSPEKQRARIAAAGAELQGALAATWANEPRGGAPRQTLARYRSAMEALGAELDVLAACRRLLAPYQGRARADRRRRLRADIAALQARLETPRRCLENHRRRAAIDGRRVDRKVGKDIEAISAALERWLP